ncbi:hypothetical protein GOV12_06510 [Candidatus Pacearchaeota archaeon]|nr:hypothetical protein [Candidatus Pacearchaeota archaeon]
MGGSQVKNKSSQSIIHNILKHEDDEIKKKNFDSKGGLKGPVKIFKPHKSEGDLKSVNPLKIINKKKGRMKKKKIIQGDLKKENEKINELGGTKGKSVIEELIVKVNDKNVSSILVYFKDKKEFYKKFKNQSDLDKKELLIYVKEQIISILKDIYESIRIDVSNLRKSGLNVSIISFTMMSIPLKIKIFEASFDKKDFFKVVRLLDESNQEIQKIKK